MKGFLKEHNIRLKKRLGQNFLIDEGILNKIVASADLKEDDVVLEIGAGIGTLTKKLAAVTRKVLAVEIDGTLVKFLKETCRAYPNIEIIQSDILKVNLKKLLVPCTKVVANLPYYITTPIIVRLLEARELLSNIIIMVQKEVARRMVATPPGKDYGAFSLLVQYHTKPRIMTEVPKGAFLPPPEVTSCVVKLEVLPRPPVKVKDEEIFFRVVRAAFAQRRKTLQNTLSRLRELNLSKGRVSEILEQADIVPSARGETLSLKEFARLSNLIVEER
jgi:16S rRNA (adenine1518-N6/adenine1519-N6)-dimethyltransferase